MKTGSAAPKPDAAMKTAVRVSLASVIVNLLLSAGKLLAGVIARSGAMVSDAVHSASDVFSSVIVIVGVKIAGREPDRDHPYGHERFECVAAVVLSVVLLFTGLLIGYKGVEALTAPAEQTPVPGLLALIAAGVSIAVKEAMFWGTRHYAKVLRSSALLADAWHHRSDALSSVGALVGILFARLGYPKADAVASLVICLFIAKAACDIFKDAVDKMVDRSASPGEEEKIRRIAESTPGVKGVDLLKTRVFGNRLYVDIEIRADGSLTLNEAHEIAKTVHNAVEDAFGDVKHIMVHVNPD